MSRNSLGCEMNTHIKNLAVRKTRSGIWTRCGGFLHAVGAPQQAQVVLDIRKELIRVQQAERKGAVKRAMRRRSTARLFQGCGARRYVITLGDNVANGRPKDKARLLQFIESGALSSERFQRILERHALAGSWRKFEQQFLESWPLKSPRSSRVNRPTERSWRPAQ
jgi:hypothetical protein